MARKKKKDKDKRKRKKKTQADKADRYELYLESVQAPDVDVRFISRVYRASFNKKPSLLREDFCGTAGICCEWAKLGANHRAIGVDIDAEPLGWGVRHNLSQLEEEQRGRVELLEANVLTVDAAPVDVIAAQNFSYFCFKTRPALRAYFEAAHRGLKEDGALVLDLFGGYEVLEDEREDVTEHDGFDYVWEQASFDPITHDYTFHIHFRFPDGSQLKRAFTYDWRLWSIPEVNELLIEAGFDEVDVYWEGADPETGEGTGVFKKKAHGTADPAWNAYMVGVKRGRR